MEIILLADVDRLGHEGEVVRVADGYAHNFLLPRKMAEPATPGALKSLEQRRRAIERREGEKRGKAHGLVERMAGQVLVIKASVGEGGRLHGQVTTQQIAEAVAEQMNREIDRRRVEIPVPIRETGEFSVKVALYKDVNVELPVRVISAVEEPPAEEEPVTEAEEQPQSASAIEAETAVEAAEESTVESDTPKTP